MNSRLMATAILLLVPLAGNSAEPALGGNCPVCLVEMGKIIPGSKQHSFVFDRQAYYFPSAKEREIFAANPAKYLPVLGGDCIVCRANMGVRVPGSIEFALIHAKKLYLFPSAKERDTFKANPGKYESADLGLAGYCSVCVLNAKRWVPGTPEFVSIYDGIRYYFPSQSEKKVFDDEPAKYTPALEGDCVVCLKAGKRVPGLPKFSAIYAGRIYLFPDQGTQKRFLANPENFANMDVANDGNCIVCDKMAGKIVSGKAEFASVYKGQRYLFPSPKERAMFDADPASFASKSQQVESSQENIRVKGKTACAGCAYGVRPMVDPESLGIAVVSGNTVYVVEGGERRYPEIFNARFEEISVNLQGTEKKRKGKFVWVEPTSLTRSP